MMAWTSPAFTERLRPLRMSLSSTLTERSLISKNMSLSFVFSGFVCLLVFCFGLVCFFCLVFFFLVLMGPHPHALVLGRSAPALRAGLRGIFSRRCPLGLLTRVSEPRQRIPSAARGRLPCRSR